MKSAGTLSAMGKDLCYFFPSIIGDDGHCAKFRTLIEHLFDFEIITYPGLSSTNDLLLNFNSIANHLAQEISGHGVRKIYFCGYSFGASISFEVSKVLTEMGTDISGIIIIDPPSPSMSFDLQKEYQGNALPERGLFGKIAKSIVAFVLGWRPIRVYFEFLIRFFGEKKNRDLTRNAVKLLREKRA